MEEAIILGSKKAIKKLSDMGAIPKVIDLDKYGGDTSLSSMLTELVFSGNGGGELSDVDLGTLFSDLDVNSLIRVQFTVYSVVVVVQGATIVRNVAGNLERLAFECVLDTDSMMIRVAVIIAVDGRVTVKVAVA